MAEPKCSQLPCPLQRTGAIRIINMRPMLARMRSRPVSRYLLRNCKAAIGAECDSARAEFQSGTSRLQSRRSVAEFVFQFGRILNLCERPSEEPIHLPYR